MLRIIKAAVLVIAMAWGVAWAELPEQTIDEIRALMQSQDKALDAHDVDGVMATFADSDDIMVMGTGPGEHWVGKQEVKDAYANIMQKFDAHTMETKCGEGAGSSQGDVVWFTVVGTVSRKHNEEMLATVINMSAVVVKHGDGWRFHTVHYSHLIGDAE
jgi:uncharacterized protein (TIGR02246 family)